MVLPLLVRVSVSIVLELVVVGGVSFPSDAPIMGHGTGQRKGPCASCQTVLRCPLRALRCPIIRSQRKTSGGTARIQNKSLTLLNNNKTLSIIKRGGSYSSPYTLHCGEFLTVTAELIVLTTGTDCSTPGRTFRLRSMN